MSEIAATDGPAVAINDGYFKNYRFRSLGEAEDVRVSLVTSFGDDFEWPQHLYHQFGACPILDAIEAVFVRTRGNSPARSWRDRH